MYIKYISISKYNISDNANVKGLDVKIVLLCLKEFAYQICLYFNHTFIIQ